MKRQHRRHVATATVLGVLIGVGLFFYFQRVQHILQQEHTPIRQVGWLSPARPTREAAQEVPDSQRFDLLERWSFADQDSLKQWEEKTFKGKTLFKVLAREGGGCLRSESQDACSGLFVKTKQEVVPDLWIDWKWRAEKFPTKKNPQVLSSRIEDDFAARVYVIFLANNFFRSDVIEYIWDEQLPVGAFADSAYSDRIKLLVLRSGPAPEASEGWQEERRNIYEDYVGLFGRQPRYAVGMIAVMSDSDNTGSSATAEFGDISLKRKKT